MSTPLSGNLLESVSDRRAARAHQRYRRSLLPARSLPRLVRELARKRRELAALAVAVVLKVDPVVGIDVLGRNVVALLQEPHQHKPRLPLLARRRLGNVWIVAHEFHADRVGLDHAA